MSLCGCGNHSLSCSCKQMSSGEQLGASCNGPGTIHLENNDSYNSKTVPESVALNENMAYLTEFPPGPPPPHPYPVDRVNSLHEYDYIT